MVDPTYSNSAAPVPDPAKPAKAVVAPALPIRLIVGLGNPGREYESTRHNVGWWWIDELANRKGVRFSPEAKFHGHTAKCRLANQDCWLLKPQTFMNLSGKSVAALAQFYRITPPEILAVHDELDIPAVSAKLKLGGGTGGHNGLNDMAAKLGSKDFWRLRLGIGHPGHRDQVVGYVLKAAPPGEQREMLELIDQSFGMLDKLEAGRLQDCVTWVNTYLKPVVK